MKSFKTVIRTIAFSYLFITIFYQIGVCQSNLLNYDLVKMGFIEKEPIPFGEKIIIKGNSSNILESLTVKSIYGINEIVSTANISDKSWTVIVGPFPKRTNIIFEIAEKRTLTKSETEEIIKYWEESVVSSLQKSIDSNSTYENREDFFNQIFNPLKNEFLTKWNSYFLPNNLELGNYVISLLEFEIINNWNVWNNNSSDLRLKKYVWDESFFFKKYLIPNKNAGGEINKILKAEDPVLYLFKLEDEDINKLFTQILELDQNSNLTENQLRKQFKSEIEEPIKKYQTAISFYSKEFNSLRIISSQTIQLTHTTNAETLGLESYLGIDLGAVYTHNTSTTNFFVNLNPYLKKTDPEKDYPLFQSNLLHNLTPSVGFGIGSGVENIKPVYFVGVGLRVNKAIRFGFGGTYYFSPEKNKYDWNQSFYGSVSINFVSDLFRLINSASTNIQN
ncbi:hypothetical protein [Belliella aquatica]|uniref:IPT/TIG domain-containing protein n=1 Tax=Belliella aquatica TaxID=1323734 RepID=A0ABQ1NB08_9BACT|nr:hypothetical protein [Belliella aquatica]MCH7407405.1 hypothetical protein [Belliella aquatica]GGC53175.1 hypothetical protein GCM10010993_34540 [Belliella aquatica]